MGVVLGCPRRNLQGGEWRQTLQSKVDALDTSCRSEWFLCTPEEVRMEVKTMAAKVGAIAGWLTLLGIWLFDVIGPMIVAGQRVTGTLDAGAITAYYGNSSLQYFAPAVIVVAAMFMVFGGALFESLGVRQQGRFFARLGLAFVIVEVPLIIAKSALGATLVSVVTSGGDIVPLFRFWDVLYNCGVYVIEAGLVIMFGLAMRYVPSFPRWMPAFSLLAGALQLVNMTALFVGIPDSATLAGNAAFTVWFIGANVGLTRLAWRPGQVPAAQPS
jgi:hypothetical protein